MTISTASANITRYIIVALLCCSCIAVAKAEDLVPSRDQSDEQISVWVNNASLNVFISQLASITGRDASIDSELQGKVSGRFNGSMADTLSIVGEQHAILFDLADDTLGAAAASSRSRATIALGEVLLDDQQKTQLLADVLPGNSLEIRDSEVLVSGHPSYVSRVAKGLLSTVARSNTQPAIQELATTVVPVAAASEVEAGEPVLPAPVLDSAAQVMLEESGSELEASTPADTASLSKPESGEFLWVTDIPGYETF